MSTLLVWPFSLQTSPSTPDKNSDAVDPSTNLAKIVVIASAAVAGFLLLHIFTFVLISLRKWRKRKLLSYPSRQIQPPDYKVTPLTLPGPIYELPDNQASGSHPMHEILRV